MKFAFGFSALLLAITCGCNLICSAKKTKEVVTTVHVTDQKDLVVKSGENPCKVLAKYCKSLKNIFKYESCFSQLHPLLLKQITAIWQQVHSKIKVDESFLIDCMPITEHSQGKQSNDYVAGLSHTSDQVITSRNSSEIIHQLLALLERAMQKDSSALNTFNTQRNELQLSDQEKLELYRKAILMLPNNLFILDQLGLALLSLDQEPKARKLWDNAVARGLWGNPLQRPVSRYVRGLTSKPWYDTDDYRFIAHLEAGYPDIKSELLKNLKERKHLFTGETENLHVGGEWTELRLKSSGYGFTQYTQYFPKTMKHIKSCGQEFTSIKFSAIQPGTHIRTHTGPSNERLRLHLTLIHSGGARIRVGTEWHTWVEGKVIMFDDSWEHEVIHTGTDIRVVLIMDIWHPELPEDKRIVH